MNVHVCTTRRPCVKCASIRTCDTRHLRDKVLSLRACCTFFFLSFYTPSFFNFCHPVAMFGIKGKSKPKRPPGTEVPPSPALPRQGSGHANMSQQSWNTATTASTSSSMPTSSLPQASPSYMLDSYYQGKC